MFRRPTALALAFGASTLASPGPPPEGAEVRAVVLGIAQDGGVPHIGCHDAACTAARRDPSRAQRVASLGLVDEKRSLRFLIDATPDLPSQIESLNDGRPAPDPLRPVDGILLTHAHVGHYAGLIYLGREALGAAGVPVYATPRMARVLRENAPWSLLESQGRIVLRELEPGREVALTPDLRVTPIAVPHREELSDTVGFRVRGPGRMLLYVPDLDRWEPALLQEAARADVALVDGTFESVHELPGRDLKEIPHPLVAETRALLGSSAGRQVLFIHLNHTNRLLWDGAARRELEEGGFRVARDGEVISLSGPPR